MSRKNESPLSRNFHFLFTALLTMRDGPPADMKEFILKQPYVGKLPPAALTLLLVVTAHFQRTLGQLRTRLAEHLPQLEGVGSVTDVDCSEVGIDEIVVTSGGHRWKLVLDRTSDDLEIDEAPMDDDTSWIDEEIDDAQNWESLVGFVADNRGDTFIDRLHRCPELGLVRRGEYYREDPYAKLVAELSSPEEAARLPWAAVEAMEEAGVVVLHSDDNYDENLPAFMLSDAALAHADLLDEFRRRWDDPALRPWLSVLIGDWEAAHAAAVALGLDDLAAAMLPQVEQCRKLSLTALQDGILGRRSWEEIESTIRALIKVDLKDLPRLEFPRINTKSRPAALPAGPVEGLSRP